MYFTCCKILGVEPGADPETIKSAFRKSAKELHPDHNPSEKAHKYFILAKNAYHYLIDHPYSKEEIKYMYKLAKASKKQSLERVEGTPSMPFPKERTYTLRQVLQHSLIARILFIFFHIMFLVIGIILIVGPISDAIKYRVDEDTSIIAAYFTLIIALFFGVLITSIFLFSGYNYLRNR